MSDIIQRTILDFQATGADSVTILKQAMLELQGRFTEATGQFDAQKITANQLIGVLKQLASGMKGIADIANADADAMAKASAETEKFIEKANAALQKQDKEEARLDAESKKRLDDKVARDQKAMDAIGAAADKAAAEAEKAADRMSKAVAQGAEKMAMDAMKARRAFEETVIPLDAITDAAMKLKSTAIDRAFTDAAAAADREKAAIEATVVPLDKLTDAAMRFKSVQIDTNLKQTAAAWDNWQLVVRDTTKGMGGFATEAERVANQTKTVGYAMMNLSYLVQDVQYGVGAVANNIGIMAMSLGRAMPGLDSFITKIGVPGGLTGLGAGIMFAAVAADFLYHNWDKAMSVLGIPIPPKLLGDLSLMEEKLKAITETKWKTNFDYSEMERLGDAIKYAKEQKAAWDRLTSGKTEEQQKRDQVVSDAIIESGAGDDKVGGAKKIAGIVEKTLPMHQSEEAKQLRIDLELAKEARDKEMFGTFGRAAAQVKVMNLEAELQPWETKETQDRAKRAEDIVTGATMTKHGPAALNRIVVANEAKFAAQGIDVNRLRGGLESATPKAIFEDERRKIAAETAAKDAARLKQIDQTNLEMKAANEKAVDDAKKEADKAAKKTKDAAEAEALWQMQQNDRMKGHDAKAGKDRWHQILQEEKAAADAMKAMRHNADPKVVEKALEEQIKTQVMTHANVEDIAQTRMLLMRVQQENRVLQNVMGRRRGGLRPKGPR